MPRILGRLWRSGARRVEITDPEPAEAEEAAGRGEAEEESGRGEADQEAGRGEADRPAHEAAADPGELAHRLEAARSRLREAIPPPDDTRDG